MSIIIKGVKMPESCGTCFVGNRTICTNGCPLGVLPDNHGRLVDADDIYIDDEYNILKVKLELTEDDAPTIVEAGDSE